ncbi:cardiolipin synthase ClsB [Rhodoferax sp. TS-BS-61-7]|uniref:cardiolipin synthase ClsB n=1 Tax=Rhodoferax sp. TS-BS-61-7 TaxID=2094194 RepID=UPI000CF6BB9F|nr:cardiolipin synthase ClsB [Rhodoferax sp. TS-BS-61-7]PQA77404.1 cardiolipin synthase ClsB [Rhodoferax sp. TS-BS-61-7]
MTDAPYLPGHQLQLLQGGQDYFSALVAAVDASQTEVRLETYIYAFDTEGERVAQALERAALRGVRVALLMDGIGTPEVPTQWQQRWNAVGVHWLRFAPLGRLGLLVPSHWRRLHRKLAVVDGTVAFCGGINILDDYNDPQHGPQQVARFDFAVQAQGPLVAQVHSAMAQLWERLLVTRQLEQGQWSAARAMWQTMARPQTLDAGSAQGGALAALVLRDNVRNRKRIERAYRKALGTAQREVLIANAYFLPGGKLLRALVHAAQRGVRVRLLLQGRYEYFMQYHAARPVFGLLLAAGVEIHEYTSGFLHAKVAVVDQQWATVGSSNLDPLSLLLAREANVVVQDTGFATALQQRLETAMAQHGRALDAQDFGQRPWGQQALDWLAYGLMRLTLLLAGRRY